jgi:hypothetical protein
MKRIFFIALMLSFQLFAQMDEGLYYSNDVYYCDIEDGIVVSEQKLDETHYIEVVENGARFYTENRLGFYHSWIYIGDFVDYETYILTDGSKFCLAPEVNGVYYFFENDYDYHEYKRLIIFQNLSQDHDHTGNYLMELE